MSRFRPALLAALLALAAGPAVRHAVAQSADPVRYASPRFDFAFVMPAGNKAEGKDRPYAGRDKSQAWHDVRIGPVDKGNYGCTIVVQPMARLRDDGTGKPRTLDPLLRGVTTGAIHRDTRVKADQSSKIDLADDPVAFAGQEARRATIEIAHFRSGTPLFKGFELRTFRAYGRVSLRCLVDVKFGDAARYEALVKSLLESFAFTKK
jgi:hypothetical protein